VGLARAISKLGYCSRSRAAELIAAGRVKWNGAVRRDPETPVHLGKDRIEIDGQPVASSSKIYLAMNKPSRSRDDGVRRKKTRDSLFFLCRRICRGSHLSGGWTKPAKDCCC